jgi:hypothetical protein
LCSVYSKLELALFDNIYMQFCFVCGKLYTKSYMRTHIKRHPAFSSLKANEHIPGLHCYYVANQKKVEEPWCGEQYEDWRFFGIALNKDKPFPTNYTPDPS